MYRDDLILRAIAGGASSTATIAEYTGISTASVWRGLHRLMESGHVFSPVRGVYRLTASGAALLGEAERAMPAPADRSAEAAEVRPTTVSPGRGQSGPGERHDAVERPQGDTVPAPAATVWGIDWRDIVALGIIVLGAVALAVLAVRWSVPARPVPPEQPPQLGGYRPPWPGIGPAQ